jgi:hypothetical protein
MFSRQNHRQTRGHGNRRSAVVVFEAVEGRQMFSAGLSSAWSMIADNAGTASVRVPVIVQSKGSQASSEVNAAHSPQGNENLVSAGLKNLILPTVGNHGILSSPGGAAQQVPDQYARQRTQLANGVAPPIAAGADGAFNAALTNAQAQVAANRNSISTDLTAGRFGGRPGGAAGGSVFAPQRTISDVKGMDFSTFKAGGRTGQLMSGDSTGGDAKSAPSDSRTVLEAAADLKGIGVTDTSKSLSKAVPILGAAVDIVASVDELANAEPKSKTDELVTGGKFVVGTATGIIALGEGIAVATGLMGAAVVTPVVGAASLAVAGVTSWVKVAGYAYNYHQTGNIHGTKGQPDPNSVGGDGTANILVTVRHGNTRAPLPGVDRPPEPGFGTFGGTPIGGAEQVVKELKGVRTVRTPGQVDPTRVNPAPDAQPGAKSVSPPATGGMGFWVGNPPPAGVR